MRLRPLLIGIVAGCVLGATACATVPSRSESVTVRDVRASDAFGPSPDVRVEPPRPKHGMTTGEAVEGFLDASAEAVDPAHLVARAYLTSHAAAGWDAVAGTRIYDGQFVNPDQRQSKVLVTLHQVAVVNEDGSYQPDERQFSALLTMKRVKGEWRIDNPPSGLLVVASEFARNFQRADVYFLDPGEDVVVADPRYFEVAQASMANRVVQALLEGPSRWLAPAVRSAIPSAATLRHSVVGDSPVVAVDLADLGRLTAKQRQGISAQIVWSIGPLNSSSVRVEEDGQPLHVPGKGPDLQTSDWQQYDPDTLPATSTLYAVHDGAVVTQTGEALPGPAGAGDYALSSMAVSVDGSRMAGVSRLDGTDVLRTGPLGDALTERLQARSLTAPTFGHGSRYVWTVRDGSQLIQLSRNGPPEMVSAPALRAIAPVTDLRLSRDGTRAAVIGRGGALYLGRMSAVDGATRLDSLQAVAPDLAGFSDVSWATGDELIGLAPANSSAAVVPWTMAVDGSTRSRSNIDDLPGPPNAVAAAPEQLTVVSSEGDLFYYLTDQWIRLQTNSLPSRENVLGTAPIYPD